MTAEATVVVDPARSLGPIDPRVYGQCIEHVGRLMYGGVFEPGSPRADEAGYRLDVLEAARGLQPTVMRWPGGNFASGYHWRDGIGPVESRPARHDLAWDRIEPNSFGTEEFLEYCRRLEAEPYVNLNASTGTFDEAQEWVEYCNSTHPLPEAQLRRAGPHPDPHDVRLWAIGNENYGWWQHMHTSADRYAELAREWGKLLHWTDPRVELVAVGGPSSDWNRTVLTDAGRSIDFLSLHFYWHGDADDRYDAMVTGPSISELEIEQTWQLALDAQRELGLHRPARLCIDEWGVWETSYRPLAEAAQDLDKIMRTGLNDRAGIDNRFEEFYDLKDAITVASWFHVMWRHPEKIGLATFAQMVNAIAPIMTRGDEVLRQTIFEPIALARELAAPTALDVHVKTDDGVPAPGHPDGSLPILDAAGTTDGRRAHLSLVNRSRSETVVVTLEGVAGSAIAHVLHHEDPFAQNTFEHPDTVRLRTEDVDLSAPLTLAPHSHVSLSIG